MAELIVREMEYGTENDHGHTYKFSLGGLVVSVLATGPNVGEFRPGRGRDF
jgi:hypothetical protein